MTALIPVSPVMSAVRQLERQGWFCRTDPRIKLLFLAVFTALNLLFLEPAALLALTLALVPLYATTRVNYRLLFTVLFGYSFFLGAVVLSQGLAPVGQMVADTTRVHYVFDLGFAAMTWEGLGIGVSRSLRFANPFLYAILAALTTDPVIMARGMIRLGLPHEIAFMVLSGLRFLPLAMEEGRNISQAQRIRGVRGFYQQFRLALFPLFLNSLRRARRMGITIEAKAWGARNWKGFLRDVALRPGDAVLAVYGLALLAAGVYVRFGLGWGYFAQVANPY